MAYEKNPSLVAKVHSTSNLPDVLDEAKYCLDYLAKTFPDNNTFVIQVGNKCDHEQGWRLPENDKLDGKRPALCALSRAHMGITTAALALGAVVFKTFDATAAALYESKAIAIYARARQNDTQTSAFEREHGAGFDYYYDPTDDDNMALAAAELYRMTQNTSYLNDGKTYAPPSNGSISWNEINALANYRLAEHGDTSARERFFEETTHYQHNNIWNLPLALYTWGSLSAWIEIANFQLLAQRLNGNHEPSATFLGTLDYTFGRNNWGIAMMASDDLPYSIRNIYNFIWHKLNLLPVGALSEGPGNKSIHDSVKMYCS
jgi:hypothetical protein